LIFDIYSSSFLFPSVSILSLFLFFLILRPPPSSTLFPYTTLFRSIPPLGHRRAPLLDPPVDAELGVRYGHGEPLQVTGRPVPHRDRKSTRLNSSHVAISYAVFCLKKKKKNTYKDRKSENQKNIATL